MKSTNKIRTALLSTLVIGSAFAYAATEAMKIDAELNAFNDHFNEVAANYDIDTFLSFYVKSATLDSAGKSTGYRA